VDLDLRSEMIIFESILTFFKLSIVILGSCGSCENWLKPKIDPPSANLACPFQICETLDIFLSIMTTFRVNIIFVGLMTGTF